MKPTTTLSRILHQTSLAGLVLVGLCFGRMQANAKCDPFSRIFVFGDSLSDTGNFYHLTGGYPPAPYYEGRFSNGPLWVEYLADEINMEYNPADNFAVAGATTGTLNSNNTAQQQYPGLLDEVASFIQNGKIKERERALYVVAAGANDLPVGLALGLAPDAIIGNGVKNTVAAVQQLRTSGAHFILVMNVPDLGVTPLALGSGSGALLTQLCTAYNQVLGAALDQLAQAGIPTIRLDSFAVLDEMAQDPAEYGFINVTIPFLLAPAGGNPDDFLFWDPFHPTTGAHEVLADEAADQLEKTLWPGHHYGHHVKKSHDSQGVGNHHH